MNPIRGISFHCAKPGLDRRNGDAKFRLTRRANTLYGLMVIGLGLVSAQDGRSASAPGACPPPAAGAFTGCYYSGTSLSGNPVFVHTDSQINFDWANSAPDSSVSPDNFSASWNGNFAFGAGNYMFTVVTSDGMRLYMDGNLILDVWHDQSPNVYTVAQNVAGGNHLVTVEYYEKTGGATAQVFWKNNSPVSQAPPVISSFAANPASAAPGTRVTLSWSVSGATAVTMDNGIGDVTNASSVVVYPAKTTKYTLTASNAGGSTSVVASAVIGAGGDSQPPTAPVLVSGTARSAAEVDLAWNASTDNVGVSGYQILRNGAALTSVAGTVTTFVDTTVSPSTTYLYTVKAYDAAGNYSAASNVIQVATPAGAQPQGACPPPATGTLTGCYYSGITLSGNPVFIRTDPQINFNWANASPDPSVPNLNFSVRWQGNFAFTAGTYLFTAVTSDGMRLYVDGNVILNQWNDQSPNVYTVSQTMSPGNHLIAVEYYEETGGATAQVMWKNTSPAAQLPVISSFSATPVSAASGQAVTLAWSAAGATSLQIDNGIGDVTSLSNTVVHPAQTTTYTLTASNPAGNATAQTTVTISSGGDTQPPTAPVLVSGLAVSPTEVDLTWTASSDNVGIAGYQIIRNGSVIGSVPGTALNYADTTASSSTTYSYSVKAYDASGNYSSASNAVQATTPATSPVSVTWYGGCWYHGTIYGITGNFQAIDFDLKTPNPVPLQGTLFDGPNCTANGGDNLNDFNSLTGSTHMIQGFSHNPDAMPTSALYWIGDRTSDGKCLPGAPCSGCINYNQQTPACSELP